MKNIIELHNIVEYKSRSKARISHTFWAILLLMYFKDLIWIFHTWVFNTTIEDTMGKNQFKLHFATTFTHLTKKLWV
jgi:hypothetical protein